MRRLPRYLPSLLLLFTTATPFVIGCDLLKQKAADGGTEDGSVVVVATDPNATAPANPGVVPVTTTAAPLNPAAPTTAVVVKTDGGVVATDSGVKTDGAAPAPIPTFAGFDAGAFKGFDAGNLFKVPDGGFKPPWPVPTK